MIFVVKWSLPALLVFFLLFILPTKLRIIQVPSRMDCFKCNSFFGEDFDRFFLIAKKVNTEMDNYLISRRKVEEELKPM